MFDNAVNISLYPNRRALTALASADQRVLDVDFNVNEVLLHFNYSFNKSHLRGDDEKKHKAIVPFQNNLQLQYKTQLLKYQPSLGNEQHREHILL